LWELEKGNDERAMRGTETLNALSDGWTVRITDGDDAHTLVTDYDACVTCDEGNRHKTMLNPNAILDLMRMTVSAGCHLPLRLIKAGETNGQAVGYARDGTMIVVSDAKALVGSQVNVVVTNTIHTKVGRIAFADLVKEGGA
jgi:uncharacterized protein YacL